jgi:hypothetical protein
MRDEANHLAGLSERRDRMADRGSNLLAVDATGVKDEQNILASGIRGNLDSWGLCTASGEPNIARGAMAGDDVGAVEVKSGANAPKKTAPNAPKIDGANAPKILEQMPQANAPNIATQTLKNVEFARPTGWSKLWRLERNGLYFKYRLRFTNAKDTPQEIRRVTRQGGKISPKIERALKKRPGHGRHATSRVEASRFRSRAIDLAGRIRSSAKRGSAGEVGEFAAERRRDIPQAHPDRNLGRVDMHGLPGVDNSDDMPGVREPDWVM